MKSRLYGAIVVAAMDPDTGNGGNDDPHLQYYEHAGSRRRDGATDIIS